MNETTAANISQTSAAASVFKFFAGGANPLETNGAVLFPSKFAKVILQVFLCFIFSAMKIVWSTSTWGAIKGKRGRSIGLTAVGAP